MIPQALAVPQSNPPPSLLPFLTAFSIIILIFISIVIFSVLASFAIIILIYIICQYLVGPTSFTDLEAGEEEDNRDEILISRQARHGGDVWREVLERKREVLERKVMAAPVRYGSPEMEMEMAANYCIDCAICLEDFESGELCQIFPVCNHIFHYSCIHHWLKRNTTCPICRCSILKDESCS